MPLFPVSLPLGLLKGLGVFYGKIIKGLYTGRNGAGIGYGDVYFAVCFRMIQPYFFNVVILKYFQVRNNGDPIEMPGRDQSGYGDFFCHMTKGVRGRAAGLEQPVNKELNLSGGIHIANDWIRKQFLHGYTFQGSQRMIRRGDAD